MINMTKNKKQKHEMFINILVFACVGWKLIWPILFKVKRSSSLKLLKQLFLECTLLSLTLEMKLLIIWLQKLLMSNNTTRDYNCGNTIADIHNVLHFLYNMHFSVAGNAVRVSSTFYTAVFTSISCVCRVRLQCWSSPQIFRSRQNALK
jgi:RsiW-degrading membrane proteinase PrsW (M82 family)